MMTTDAQSRATANYRKRSVRQVVVRFWPKDAELYAFVKERGGAVWLRELAQREYDSRERE